MMKQVIAIESCSFLTKYGSMSITFDIKKRQKWNYKQNPYISDRVLLIRQGVTLNISKAEMEKYFKLEIVEMRNKST